MNTHLKEEVDYNWIKKESAYGFTHTLPELKNGTILRREFNPSYRTIVMLDKENELIPVFIIDGQYEVNGRVSNFWSWYEINEDQTISEKKSGYGYFFKAHMNFKVNQSVSVSV